MEPKSRTFTREIIVIILNKSSWPKKELLNLIKHTVSQKGRHALILQVPTPLGGFMIKS